MRTKSLRGDQAVISPETPIYYLEASDRWNGTGVDETTMKQFPIQTEKPPKSTFDRSENMLMLYSKRSNLQQNWTFGYDPGCSTPMVRRNPVEILQQLNP